MSLVERNLTITFRLGEGSYGDGGYNSVKLEGLRASAVITKAGSFGMNQLELRVWGVPLTIMNKVSTLGKLLIDGRNNTVQVEAGDAKGGMNIAYVGTIITAYSDFRGAEQGDVSLVVSALTAQLQALKPADPASYSGPVDAATVIQQMATKLGFGFENNGVSVQIASGAYYPGTGRDQLYKVAQTAGINLCIDDASSPATQASAPVVAIWPKNSSRNKAAVTLAAKDRVSYPQWTDKGIKLQCLYNPNLVYGATVNVDSIVVPASGAWTIFAMTHELESQVIENGKWFTTMECSLFGKPVPVSQG